MNAPVLKPVYDGRTGRAVNFFLAGEGEIHIVLRHKTIRNQLFRRFQNAAQCPFGVQRSASPEHAVFQNPFKRRFIPLGFFCRNNIVVGHQHNGVSGFPALPVIEHAVFTQKHPFAAFMYAGIKFWQKVLEFFKFCLVDKGRIVIGNGPAAEHFLHV